MKHYIKLCIFVFLFSSACKKENLTRSIIGKIDISNAISLIFCRIDIDPLSGGDISDSIKLYKLTNADEVHPAVFLSDEENDLGNEFVPDGIFNLNAGYFLLNVFHKSDQNKVIESYIVSKLDGKATLLTVPIVPSYFYRNKWIKGYPSEGFASTDNNTFYIPDGAKINKLVVLSDGIITHEVIALNNPHFAVDTLGNVLAGNTLELADKTQIQIPEIPENSLFVNQFGSGFYTVSLETDTVRINKLDIVLGNYVISDWHKLSENAATWHFLGRASIRNLNGSCLVFDKAIIYIDSEDSRFISFSTLGLISVKTFYVSDNELYVYALNKLNKEVFLKINPKMIPLSYSDVFAPDMYTYFTIQVAADGAFSFNAKQIYGTKELIGYRSSTQTVNIIENDYSIKVKQVLTLK